MAKMYLYRNKLSHNYAFLKNLFLKNKIDVSIVTKILCGNHKYIKEILDLAPKQVCDSRISNLKIIKKINPDIETIYIKPPSPTVIKSLVKFADISFNTEVQTIKLISREALKTKKIHKIILMVELGDLREGVLGKNLLSLYSKVHQLKGIQIIGIGSNLNCLHGVMPSVEKLNQLNEYKVLIEKTFNKKIKYVSGGTTVTIPLLLSDKKFPKTVNHFRVGEALFFGADLFNDKTIQGMYPFVFELEASVIEVNEKPSEPYGDFKENPQGIIYKKKDTKNSLCQRAILDIGVLDIQPQYLIPKNKNIEVIAASSDMLVVDISKSRYKYSVGSTMKFQLKYMGALSLLNSKYIDKVVL